MATLCDEICAFVKAGLDHITNDEGLLAELGDITSPRLNERREAAHVELERLRQDERQQPITYNHYYTDNVQNARQDSTRKIIRKAMEETRAQDWNGKLHISNNSIDAEKLLASLQKHVIVDMEGQACAEALAGLQAYYKVILIHLMFHAMANRFRSPLRPTSITCVGRSLNVI